MPGAEEPFVVAERARPGTFSPDRRRVAVESNDTGRRDVHVPPFPGPGERVQVSTSGGTQEQWRRDGRELYYIALDDRLMASRAPLRRRTRDRGGCAGSALAHNVNDALQLNSNAVHSPSAVVDEGDIAPTELILNSRPEWNGRVRLDRAEPGLTRMTADISISI